jgi:RNA polymerase sigma-70 factor (ECF subfamily)
VQPISDHDLVRRCHEGEEEAFTTLYKRHRQAVMNFAGRMLGDPDLAADVLSETFAYFFRKIPTYRFEAPVRALLFKAARNLCLNMLDRRRRASAAPLEAAGHIASGDDPAVKAEQGDLARQVREGLASMPPLYREVITLRLLEGLSYEEIALVADCPVGTVKSRLHNGIALLRKSVRIQ